MMYFQETPSRYMPSARYRAVEPVSGSNVIPGRARSGLAGFGFRIVVFFGFGFRISGFLVSGFGSRGLALGHSSGFRVQERVQVGFRRGCTVRETSERAASPRAMSVV